jgi:acetyl esterase
MTRQLIFEPAGEPVAGIVMFHGGALRKGSPDDLAPHCERLATRGIFAVSAGYRLIGRDTASIDDCIADVRAAVSQFRGLAASRGLDPARLASGGSSAGAHLALVAAMIEPEPPGPAAVVALNPVVDLPAYPPEELRSLERSVGIAPGRAVDYSPIAFVRPGNPATLIQHGTLDEIASIDTVRRFRDLMVRAGNDCVLLEYEGAKHAFHYAGYFDDVMDATARFLLERLAGLDAPRPGSLMFGPETLASTITGPSRGRVLLFREPVTDRLAGDGDQQRNQHDALQHLLHAHPGRILGPHEQVNDARQTDGADPDQPDVRAALAGPQRE